MVRSLIADDADLSVRHNASSPWTANGHTMQLAPANIHAQVAKGAALNLTTGFTLWPTANGNVGYSLEVVVGAQDTPGPVVYTITGTWGGVAQVDTITATAAGTFEGTLPFDVGGVTSITSDVDPTGTTDIKTLDMFAYRPMRGLLCTAAGNVYARFSEDTNDTLLAVLAGVTYPVEWNRIRCSKSSGRAAGISPSTASITVGR